MPRGNSVPALHLWITLSTKQDAESGQALYGLPGSPATADVASDDYKSSLIQSKQQLSRK